MNYQIKEVIRIMEDFDKASRSMPMAKLDSEAIKIGLQVSKNACKQAEHVVATPYMKNLLVAMGDVKQERDKDGEWRTTKLPVGAECKAVTWIGQVVNAALQKYNGAEKHDYPTNVQIDDPVLYDVDCWNGWKEKVWDIVPGQEKETEEGFQRFRNPVTNLSVRDLIKLIQRDEALQKAIEIELSILPEVQASREVTKISDPFMSKGTGVSYPDYKNDRTPLPDSDITFGKHEIMLTQKAADKGLASLIQFALDNNVYTGYTRRQRGKGRPLIAQSRRANLVVNMINGVEMEHWKKDNRLNLAFLPEDEFLQHQIEKGEWLLSHPDYDIYNFDGSKWDQNLGIGWVCLQDTLRHMKAQGSYSKELVKLRYLLNSKGYLVDGINGSVKPIYGRMFSGYDDTTLGNTEANRIISTYYALKCDPKYVQNVVIPTGKKHTDNVGDDTQVITKKGTESNCIEVANNDAKIVVHIDEKHARGLMFVQWRTIRKNGKWLMAYNWPRVLRSMLSKEDTKSLGKAGWTIASYQQLGKLRMYPEMLQIVVSIIAALDKDHLMLEVPVREILKMVQEEDANRVKEGASNRKSKLLRSNTTAERLFNSNPNIAGIHKKDNGDVELDPNYFEELQPVLKDAYNRNFLTNLGFKNPDLSIVH